MTSGDEPLPQPHAGGRIQPPSPAPWLPTAPCCRRCRAQCESWGGQGHGTLSMAGAGDFCRVSDGDPCSCHPIPTLACSSQSLPRVLGDAGACWDEGAEGKQTFLFVLLPHPHPFLPLIPATLQQRIPQQNTLSFFLVPPGRAAMLVHKPSATAPSFPFGPFQAGSPHRQGQAATPPPQPPLLPAGGERRGLPCCRRGGERSQQTPRRPLP